MIIINDDLMKKLKKYIEEKGDPIIDDSNICMKKNTEIIKDEQKRELQKLTEEQKKKIMDALDDFASIYFVDEFPDAEYITEYDILMKQKEEEWKLHFLEDNTPSEIKAILELCDEYMESKKNPRSIEAFASEFSFIMNYDVWLNKSAVWPVMYNPEWEKWEKLKKIKVRKK